MKVVINKCFGGFGLSDEAENALIGKCSHVELVEPIEYYGGPGSKFYEANKDRYKPDHWRESYERDLRGNGLTRFHDDKVICDNHRDNANRTCPALVRVIERLGDTASGRHARLQVVEIPDDVEFEISEYDGREHIAEAHRTWS